jgi:signal transduction histidine kinase
LIHRTRRLHRANKPADPPPSEQAVIVGSPETYSRTFRSWPLLILAFGVLIALMIGGDLATMDRARRLHDAISEVNETYQKSAQRLEQLRAGIHLSSLLLRDYLLDPRAERAVKYRDQMTDLRKRIDEDLVELDNSMPSHESDKVHEMQRELNEYWDSLDPVFAWSPQEKHAYSFAFLRHRVIPKREIVLGLASDVEAFNKSALDQQRTRVAQSEENFSGFLRSVMLASLVCGLIVAFASIFRVSQLERRSEHQHGRALAAENQMRQLSQQLVRAQEEERRSLSRELHDEIGQMLTGLRMEFRSLAKMHGAPAREFQARIDQGRVLLDQSLQSVRDIAMGLRPSMLDDLGLEAALRWQARDFCRRNDIPVNVEVRAPLDDLQDRQKTNLYRIVQEALTNCAKHSKARSISILLEEFRGDLRLTIRDDGVGLKAGAYGKGLGLVGIQERARELGGSMRIESGATHGTALTVIMPAQRSPACV